MWHTLETLLVSTWELNIKKNKYLKKTGALKKIKQFWEAADCGLNM